MLVAIAGRYGLVPGLALTRKFGTEQARQKKAQPHIDDALEKLDTKQPFTGNTLITQDDYSRALDTLAVHEQNSKLAGDSKHTGELRGRYHASNQIENAAMRSMGSRTGRYVEVNNATTVGR